ncbi:MAG TPA: polysaccharide deacetylase family protein [Stellaceae bacterium]|nr:polysaccharide deacetylase family protein [Stellaceae bacterium]
MNRKGRITAGLLLVAALLLATGFAGAAEPEFVTHPGPSRWPEALSSAAAFDRASRGEILVFAAALDDAARQDEASLIKEFHIAQADVASVRRVAKRLSGILLGNYRVAATSCAPGEMFCDPIADEDALAAAGRRMAGNLPAASAPWYADARAFYVVIAAEAIRLAAIFPQTSSEIDTYSSIERDGFEREDRHFLLTFDDGPTKPGGATDVRVPVLDAAGIHAVFFLVGEQLEGRLKEQGATSLNELYAGQCTALHGWRHLSHATWPEWQASVIRTRDLVQHVFPDQYRPWFRPPYGERRPDSGPFFAQHGLSVALWNINSQDWRESTTADDVKQQVARLMLVWRRGTILFHDTVAKAPLAVPWLIDRYREAGVVWDDCR